MAIGDLRADHSKKVNVVGTFSRHAEVKGRRSSLLLPSLGSTTLIWLPKRNEVGVVGFDGSVN